MIIDRVIHRWAFIPPRRRQRIANALRDLADDHEAMAGNSAELCAVADLRAAADLLDAGARVVRRGSHLHVLEATPK